jgi:hypothetical protein
MKKPDKRAVAKPISRREFLGDAAIAAALAVVPFGRIGAGNSNSAVTATKVHIDTSRDRVLNTFDPDVALGSSMDILPPGVVDKIYTKPMIEECLSAGWGPITYRQNTELQIAAWHWNPKGTWSDSEHNSGYFTGNTEPTEFIRHSYACPLPHRGSTRDGAAGIRGYSRLTDGNPATYWKSNPYLTKKFTGDIDHPQWVVIDLGAVEPINIVRIDWANPYALNCEVQYWAGEDPMTKPVAGTWTAFPEGVINGGQGGTVTLKLSLQPIAARFLRIWMTESSNTCSTHDRKDPRSWTGYAIHEIYAGSLASDGEFVDVVRHSPDAGQTVTFCSSVDPWHSASDLDLTAGDQTGFDLFFTSGITNNLPAMIPVAMLFGTPEDSAAQLTYLKKRGYAISYIEMGEEPDGQFMLPEDYGALYLQWATALHRVDPGLKLGGPVFTGLNEDLKVWPDAQGRTSWLGRFLDYLKSHGRMSDLAFMSFEHYPFPPCEITWTDLYREPQMISHILQVWRDGGLPANVPMMNTESNVTWELALPMTEIFSALWLADSVGSFLASRGYAYYHSPIQPEPLRPGCQGWTTYGNFVANEALQIRTHTAQYHASRLINLEWIKHGAGVHRLFPAACELKDGAGHILITAYAVHRPDGEWSLLLVNKDESNAHPVQIAFENSHSFAGTVTLVSFGSEQYVWRSEGANSHPDPNLPPARTKMMAAKETVFTLPKASITVLRGKLAAGA